ncbi:MAG: carboxy-S-adenosyl-L-methionine synthase CmoA [Desulfuromonadales bacterium]|nr:carboxy-S-adenosyl-L-methionine synthase CmoA [Desulfuromonadales bacterium]MDH3807631.1 carboxy-S-adenosyl-L-methionine synthase CmoA [Desulfuromonadales bacterium]MDH3869749.1 carboxy-S-adenosyl-L-methionine synthase CmoA [Desulfuromonadales bacterium]MDH3961402.1 carboxy-S-adenosyl-L-methionine synthase CmoA [Desulfuromonadales bacterium]MDH4025268.1 carboxy-S-adenosyl-L-methionine synthase CmoA [Desulfuromonadales bacterium]
MVKKQDEIYASPLNEIIDFDFDEKVADVFPDMIQRSVPGYGTMISTIGILAAKYAQPNSRCYDLGCSLGAVSLSMRQRINQPDCKIIAVDNSEAMVERGMELLASDNSSRVPVEMVCADIQDIAIEDASVVVLNFTLQFIPLDQRLALITRIYQGLKPGGVLILSEKMAFEDQIKQAFHTEAHHDFKRANGYSDLEISQKRTALDRVMIPESLARHKERLRKAGFPVSEVWFQCFNFASMIAIK